MKKNTHSLFLFLFLLSTLQSPTPPPPAGLQRRLPGQRRPCLRLRRRRAGPPDQERARRVGGGLAVGRGRGRREGEEPAVAGAGGRAPRAASRCIIIKKKGTLSRSSFYTSGEKEMEKRTFLSLPCFFLFFVFSRRKTPQNCKSLFLSFSFETPPPVPSHLFCSLSLFKTPNSSSVLKKKKKRSPGTSRAPPRRCASRPRPARS